jgi:hypothetical protein
VRMGPISHLRNTRNPSPVVRVAVLSSPASGRRMRAGKTCIVDTAMRGTWGVVHVLVTAGSSHEKIVKDSLVAVTRSRMLAYDQSADARRVLWWHRLFFRTPATLVLQAAERDLGKE